MEQQLGEVVRDLVDGVDEVTIEDFQPIPGGFSRETFRFDAVVGGSGGARTLPMILRKDPPAAVAILKTSREVEHDLIEAVRTQTSIPVSRSYGSVMDPAVFGEPAMLLERAGGNPMTSDLFNDGPDTDQADSVMAHLCEAMAELHTTDIATLNSGGALSDPRDVGVDISSWDNYMDSTFDYYLRSYGELNYDPNLFMLLDSFLTLRRNKPRPLPLGTVHGDFNPANFLYADGKVTAIIDWENSRIGDPREDLGWMMMMDALSATSVMAHPADKGGFLGYYNELTGFDITVEELGYFTLFGTANIGVPVQDAVGRRVRNENTELLHYYILQPSTQALLGMGQLMAYPGMTA